MARCLVSLLSLFFLSATIPTGSHAFAFLSPLTRSTFCNGICNGNTRSYRNRLQDDDNSRRNDARKRGPTRGLASMPSTRADALREEGAGGAERARLAESIAEEFRARVSEVRQSYSARLEHERALHRLEMSEQKVQLLEGMVPLSTHEAVVESYETSSAAALRQVSASSAAGLSSMAGDFTRRQKALLAKVDERDASVRRASSDLRDMSGSLAALKRDVSALRGALDSHASRAEDARNALAREIRRTEVEPQRQRADAAEIGLSELRQATHGWLAAAHELKLGAAAEALEKGYSQGRSQGLSDGALAAETETDRLRKQLHAAREAFSEQFSRAGRERLALREEIVEARNEAVDMVAASAAAGAEALIKSRSLWKAEGRAEGFSEGLEKGFQEGFLSQGYPQAEGPSRGEMAEGIVSLSSPEAGRVPVEEERRATIANQEEAFASNVMLRETFAAYVVSAHEQQLRVVEAERRVSAEAQRGLSEELAKAHEMLAKLLTERIAEMESRRDLAIGDVSAAAAAIVDIKSPSDEVGQPTGSSFSWPGAITAAGVAIGAAKAADIGGPFWQECGGGGGGGGGGKGM